MTPHDTYMDELALLAVGALEPADAAPVRVHLGQCDECSREYRRMRAVADVLALGAQDPADAPKPSPRLKARVMAATRTGRPRAFLPYLIAAACLVLAIVFGALYGSLGSRNAALQTALRRQNQVLSDLASADARRYPVRRGEIVRSGSRLYLAMRDLPAVASGKAYQIWLLPTRSKRMRPSITFKPSAGLTLIRVPVDASTVAAIAISVEPKAGSLQPTTKPLFIVKFG